MAAAETLLLVLPVNPLSKRHWTSNIIWFLGAFSWYYGPTGRKLLKVLWKQAGLLNPPDGLTANNTELALLPSRHGRLDPREMILHELFGLLSEKPPLSSAGERVLCRCFDRGAVWGHPEYPLSVAGDLMPTDVSAARSILRGRYKKGPHVGMIRTMPMWLTPGQRAVRVLLQDRGISRRGRKPFMARNVSNMDQLYEALRTPEGNLPLCSRAEADDQSRGCLAVARVKLEKLPLAAQLSVLLHWTNILIAAYGASLASIPLLRGGSHVIELRPGPLEKMAQYGTCLHFNPQGSPWDANPNGEWGAMARAAQVFHACTVFDRTWFEPCFTPVVATAQEVESFQVDVPWVKELAYSAAAYHLRL